MPLRLRVIPPSSRQTAPSGDAGERAIDFDDGVGQIRIGRRADLELSLPFSPLSGVHARLVRASDSADKTDRWLLEDLGSTNGTFVGGERLKPGVKVPVTAGMQIKFAEVKLIFDGPVRAKGEAAVDAEVPNKATGKVKDDKTRVQGEASNKVQGEASNKVQRRGVEQGAGRGVEKVQGEASNKATGKTGSEVSSKSGGKVQGEASNKATGKTGSEVSSKSGGKVQGEASNKVTGKTGSEVSSKSGGKVPLNDPTQTYVRPQFTDVISSGPAAAQVPYLTAVAGITEGDTAFRLEQRDHVYMFGRTRRCEFRVNGTDVSREHASFVRRADGVYVNDLGSVNGVLVNNTRVKEYRLYDGDLIQIGHVKLRLFDPSEPSPRESERPASSSPLSRSTPSRSVPSHGAPSHRAPSFGAAHDAHAHVEPPSRAYEPPPARSDASADVPFGAPPGGRGPAGRRRHRPPPPSVGARADPGELGDVERVPLRDRDRGGVDPRGLRRHRRLLARRLKPVGPGGGNLREARRDGAGGRRSILRPRGQHRAQEIVERPRHAGDDGTVPVDGTPVRSRARKARSRASRCPRARPPARLGSARGRRTPWCPRTNRPPRSCPGCRAPGIRGRNPAASPAHPRPGRRSPA